MTTCMTIGRCRVTPSQEQFQRMVRWHTKLSALREFTMPEVSVSAELMRVSANPVRDPDGKLVVHLATQELDDEFCRVVREAHRLDEIGDTSRVFFVECFHVMDWIENDASAVGLDVRAYVRAMPDLALAQDICNGAKHLVLTRPRPKPTPTVRAKSFDVDTTRPRDIVLRTHLAVEVSGQMIDGFDLADRCVVAWRDFLMRHGLL